MFSTSTPLKITVKARKPELIPQYATPGAAGCDVRADLKMALTLLPGKMAKIPTGLSFEIPHGFEIQVRPRSGLASKHAISIVNTPGTIDSDYRGEVQVLLINHSDVPFEIEPGMRIAQLIVAPVLQAEFISADELTETLRGAQGFGHTGIN